MGGMIGQTYALKYPGMFRSLALCDTTSRYPAEAPAFGRAHQDGRDPGHGALVEPTLARWFTEPFRKATRKWCRKLRP